MDILRSITQTEMEAEQIRKKSIADCRRVVLDAQKEASQLMDQKLKQAEAEGHEIVAEAEREAQEEVRKIEDNTADECAALQQQARKKMKKAVDIILGRIVKAHGNS